MQLQLDAYNRRDIDTFMETYSADAQQFEYPDTLLASGAAQLRERTVTRFEEANLHAKLINRIVLGQIVIGHEEVTRTSPDGTGKLELVAIYEIIGSKIVKARFNVGTKTIDPEL